MAEDMNIYMITRMETPLVSNATFAKPLLDVSKIQVFASQHFQHLQEHVDTRLDMHGVVFSLTTKKPNSASPAKELEQWNHTNKYVVTPYLVHYPTSCLMSTFPIRKQRRYRNMVENVVRQQFIIDNYYFWTMIEDKNIKVKINQYQKLLEDLKVKNTTLPNGFVSKLLIKKLPKSWTSYKQQLKHKHKQMFLSDLITHIIIKDIKKKGMCCCKDQALSTKANMVQHKPTQKRYSHKSDHNKNKNKNKNNFPRTLASTLPSRKREIVLLVEIQDIMHLSAIIE